MVEITDFSTAKFGKILVIVVSLATCLHRQVL